MRLGRQLIEKPIEVIAAVAMLMIGIAMAGLHEMQIWQAVGSILASLGGALLAWSASSADSPDRARVLLRSELQAASRHLADISGKISRIVVQSTQEKLISHETAIDRIGQLTSTMYGIINDLDMIAGEKSSYIDVIETVTACEDLALQFEQLTFSGQKPESPEQLQLREQLESLRMQFASMKRTATHSLPPSEVSVACPYCNHVDELLLGPMVGDSATNICKNCLRRYHVHRFASGVGAREWGGASRQRMHVRCPECQDTIPINFKETSESEDRFCMTCFAHLEIDPSGQVVVRGKVEVRDTIVASITGDRPYLECPSCKNRYPALVWDELICKGVCNGCKHVLMAKRADSAVEEKEFVQMADTSR